MLAKLAAHASRAIALTHGIPAISQDQLDVARKARCAHFVRDAHKRSQSQDPPAISHVQLNIPAIFYKAGNTVTVLAKLAAHALHAIAHNAHTRGAQCIDKEILISNNGNIDIDIDIDKRTFG